MKRKGDEEIEAAADATGPYFTGSYSYVRTFEKEGAAGENTRAHFLKVPLLAVGSVGFPRAIFR